MQAKTLAAAAFGSALLAACASDPIIDARGVDAAEYDADWAECRAYSEQVDTGGQMAKHGAVGAAAGAAIGAIIGGVSAGEAAGAGAVAGALEGGADAQERKERVFRNCMDGRGYRVLG